LSVTVPGLFFLVVGPSGAGKDSLIDGARERLADGRRHVFARRAITRAADAPGEDHESLSQAEFERREAAGEFLVTWQAHGLSYGLPASLLAAMAQGANVVANGSRRIVGALARKLPDLCVIEVSAPPEVLAARIAGRGRESGDALLQRLARRVDPMPDSVLSLAVDNDATLAEGIDRFVEAIASFRGRLAVRALDIRGGTDRIAYLPASGAPEGLCELAGHARIELVATGGRRLQARVHVCGIEGATKPGEIGLSVEAFEALGVAEGTPVTVRAIPAPRSRELLSRKIRGEALDEPQYRRVLRDVVEGRYSDRELTAFLVAATRHLSDAEVLSLARVRTSLAHQIAWDEKMVVDKHSMGGIPGNRLSPIVVPLVAAHGLAMPKTSSRAITSAAGTADTMEVVARVDLNAQDVRRCVAQARACIAWNGRLSHSLLDEVMNAITRPLAIDSNRWSVASILSKKKAAGATHVIVDLPYGPHAKIHGEQEALALAALFEATGRGIGLQVRALATDGSQPIGHGIGPALEMRDVLQVLDNDARAPADLREKALLFAGVILSWDPAVGSVEAGRGLAQSLLQSGAARQAFERIVNAQGRNEAPPAAPSALVHVVRAPRAGKVVAIDGWAIAGIARRAGAPGDPGAGIDLRCKVGDAVEAGDVLYRIHAASPEDLAACRACLEAGSFCKGEAMGTPGIHIEAQRMAAAGVAISHPTDRAAV
jgi:thymidine phosphorylase